MRAPALLLVTAGLALAGCAGDQIVAGPPPTERATTTTAPPPPTTVTAPATTAPRRMAAPATTTAATTVPTTSVAPPPSTSVVTTTTAPATTTTEPPLPVPVAAPAEDGSDDPAVTIGRIRIPAIGLDRPLGEGIRLSSFDRGPSHWPGTALPGQLGNVVIGGHRVSHNADFRHLDDLQVGDEVVLSNGDQPYVYRVERTEVVTPDAIHIVDQTRAFTATLFACHPPGSTRERIVIHLTLVA